MFKKTTIRAAVVVGFVLVAVVASIYAQHFSMTRVERVQLASATAATANPLGTSATQSGSDTPQSYPVAIAVISRPGTLARNRNGLQPVMYAPDVNDSIVASDTAAEAISAYDASSSTTASNGANGLLMNVGLAKGRQLRKIGHAGKGPGEFHDPHGLSGDADGNLWVADSGNDRIQKLTLAGQPLLQIGKKGSGNGELKSPYGVVVDRDGTILVADTGNHRVQRFSRTGEFISAFGSQGSDPGQFFYPQAITVDRLGNIFVADFANHRVEKFSSDGKFLKTFGSLGSQPGQFNYPSSLAIDSQDRLWVTDLLNHRLQVFSLNGDLLGTYGSYSANASAPDEFNHPRGIAIQSSGDIWIAHPGVHSVDHLRMGPTAVARR